MSKRQALGAITNSSNVVLGASAAATGTTGATLFNHQNINIFKQPPPQKSTTTSVFNNENQPPPNINNVKSSINNKPGGSEFEFEIFQEERGGGQNQRNPPLGPSLLPNQATARLREKQPQVNFFLETQEEEEEEDDEEEIVQDKRKHDDEEDDDDDDEDKENDEEGLEEEGISRLNIAAMMDSASSSSKEPTEMNTSHCELMMDSQDESMLLDDTIKDMKSAASSLYIDDEEEEEEEQNASYDVDEEEGDEEVQRRLASVERDNVTMNFLEYKDEILGYMRRLEMENRPKSSYMKKQMDITPNMRSILVDWLVEVCEEYKLNVETLYLAVNYTDRFLSQMSVLRGKLQLVGTASMYIAAKYEEVAPPDITEFVYITDDTYTRKQVLRMEHLLLKVLDFKMSSPTANWFLSHFLRFIRQTTSLSHSNNTELGQRIENLARYLCELTLIESDTYLAYLPSQIAASAVYLSMYTLGRPWTKQVADLCGYSHDLVELKPCIQEMFKTLQGALDHPQQAIQEKYKQSKYDYVALIEPPKTLPPHLV